MKVKDLIQQLQEYDPEEEVKIIPCLTGEYLGVWHTNIHRIGKYSQGALSDEMKETHKHIFIWTEDEDVEKMWPHIDWPWKKNTK